MGAPRLLRKKFEYPRHPWNRARIEQERIYKKDYGFKNKIEMWKIGSKLKRFKDQAKKLTRLDTEQAKKEEQLLLAKLIKMGLLKQDATLSDILGLKAEDIFARRLQSIVYQSKLARTIKQSRQLITHGHIQVNNKKVTVPSYIVNKEEEKKINYSKDSSFNSKDHPERVPDETLKQKIVKKEVKEEKPEAL